MSEITKPTTHILESTPASVSSGVLDPSRPAAVTIDPGDIVSYPNTWTQWGNRAKFGMSFADREPLRRQFPSGPYSNLGPVEVHGAEPGDVLECRMLSLRTIDRGWNSFPLGVGALPADFEEPYVHYFRFDEQRESSSPEHRCSCRCSSPELAYGPVMRMPLRATGSLTRPRSRPRWRSCAFNTTSTSSCRWRAPRSRPRRTGS